MAGTSGLMLGQRKATDWQEQCESVEGMSLVSFPLSLQHNSSVTCNRLLSHKHA